MAEWWEQFAQDVAGQIRGVANPIAKGLQDFSQTIPQRAAMLGVNALRSNPLTGPGATIGAQVFGKAPNYGNKTPAPQRFGGADNRTPSQMPNLSQPTGTMGMTDEELMQWALAGQGGGAPDLSGFNDMLGDVNTRRDQLNIRKWQQRKFLGDLFNAAESRDLAAQAGIAERTNANLASDAERRAAEVAMIRGEDATRLAEANAARGALGATPGADLSSEVAQNAAGGVGAAGSVAERDARIQESLQNQQLNRQISGLVPMEQMAVGDLMSGYEDRLAGLASERAAIRAQMAQARAAARGGGGPSVNEKLAALGFINQLNAPGESATAPGVLGFLQQSQGATGNTQMYNDLAALGGRILSTARTGRIDPTKPAGASELLQDLITNDPAARALINRDPSNTAWLMQYITSAGKAQ